MTNNKQIVSSYNKIFYNEDGFYVDRPSKFVKTWNNTCKKCKHSISQSGEYVCVYINNTGNLRPCCPWECRKKGIFEVKSSKINEE